jgi:hypothetical protein
MGDYDEFDFDLDLDNDLKSINIDGGSMNRTPVNTTPDTGNRTFSFNNKRPTVNMRSDNIREIDFGLDLLVNKNKQRKETNSPIENSVHSNPPSYVSPSRPEPVDTDELLNNSLFDSDIENIDLDKELGDGFSNTIDGDMSSGMTGPSYPSFNTPKQSPSFGQTSNNSNYEQQSSSRHLNYEELQRNKFDLLCKFETLKNKGVRMPKTFSMSSDYDEMRFEYDRLVYQRKLNQSIKTQRYFLMSFVSGAEYLNENFGEPLGLGLKLDGFSQSVGDEINDYDDIFEELYEKYRDTAEIMPEMKLLFKLFGSAFMYHMFNVKLKNSLPGADEILKQNPELMNQFQQATINTMAQNNPGFAGFMGNILNNRNKQNGTGNDFEVPPYKPTNSPPFKNPSPNRLDPRPNISNPQPPGDIDEMLANISGFN